MAAAAGTGVVLGTRLPGYGAYRRSEAPCRSRPALRPQPTRAVAVVRYRGSRRRPDPRPPVPQLPPRAAFRREATWRADVTTVLAHVRAFVATCGRTAWWVDERVEAGVGDGDGWVTCALGHRHWGLFGAAGLLVGDGSRVLLQHRAPNTHGGSSWALPGGARDSHEDAVAAALREAGEETTLDTATVTPTAAWTDEHGGWSYTTIVAHSSTGADVAPANWESTEMSWWPVSEVAALHLHAGFAAAWPHLQTLLPLPTNQRPPGE